MADNAPQNLYATITKDGKVIAEVYKSGVYGHPSSVDLPVLTSIGSRSELAEARTAEIAKLTGGEVTYANGPRNGSGNGQLNANTLFQAQLLAFQDR
jgi:hypothetical protein